MSSILSDQEGLLARLTTPFGDSDLILRSLRGREAISELFEFHVVFAAKDNALDSEKAIGSSMNIVIKSDSQERYIDGVVAEFSQGATETQNDIFLTEYAVTLKPSLWLLTLDRNHLIFQNKTSLDIIKKVLSDCGVKEIEDKTKSCGRVSREYCVQYGESSFNFISRLMEEEGIFYFFKHSSNKHTMVLADSASAHEKMPKTSKVGFMGGRHKIFPLGKVFHTSMTTTVQTGGCAMADYNYTISQTKLYSKLDSKWKGQISYEYPGCFAKSNEGESLSKLRVQLFELNHCLLNASSTAANITAGFSFEVFDHHVEKFNKEYVALAVSHFLDFSASSGYAYRNNFNAFGDGIEFRPPRKTPKPRIYGTQTAIVTCPAGEEIFKNEHGCIKVFFHWDQVGKMADTSESSCWIRVAQLLAGSNWGGIFIPRVGQEVVVTFLEGDPDRPLIVGCVYNDQYMPEYSDKEAMKSALKTVTFKDPERFHEFRINDEKDKEELYVHASKDVYVNIVNSRKTEIEESNDTLDLFKGSRTITLKADGDNPGNHSLFLKKGDQIVELTKGDRTITMKEGAETIVLENGNRSVMLKKGNQSYEIKGDYTIKVSGNLKIKVDGNIDIESGGKTNMKTKATFNAESTGAMSLKTGAGGAFSAETGAGGSFSLKSGVGGALSIESGAGGGMTIKSGLNLEASAAININLKANAMLEASGMASCKITGAIAEVLGQGTAKVSAPMITVGGGMLQLG
ncbi:MAG: type VI secretion system tip protein VgrG [Holosporaceae bacterium]|nr:type VI secretion system tip protein VgrG [Holosporaceae bacterium]